MAGQPGTDGFMGGNLLVYRIGSERYASPLASVREVVDLPEREDMIPYLEGRPIRVSSLGKALAVDEASPRPGTRSVLVVDTSSVHEQAGQPNPEQPWIGFEVDRVEGMVSVNTVYRVPDAITELPEGAIAGAFMLPTEVGGRGTPSAEEEDKPESEPAELGRWLAGDGVAGEVTTAGPSGEETAERKDLVLILDLALLPRAVLVASER